MIAVILSEQQKQEVQDMLDVAVKKHGMDYYLKVAILLATLNNSTGETDELLTHSFNDEQIKVLNELFDIYLKENGLSAFGTVFKLSTHFQRAINVHNEETTRLAESVEE